MSKHPIMSRNAVFWRGTLVALGLSLAGAVIYSVSSPLLGAGLAARLMLVVLSCFYLLYVLKSGSGCQVRLNGIDTQHNRAVLVGLCLWVLLVGVLAVFNPSIWIWLVLLVALVWVVRCLRCYQSLLLAGADAMINGLALLLALATVMHTQSVFLSLWCFFLIEMLVIFLPGIKVVRPALAGCDSEQSFDVACHTAETAIRRMSSR